MDKYSEIVKTVIYLAGCAVNGTQPAQIESELITSAFDFASRHMLSSLISIPLEKSGQGNEKTAKAVGAAVRKAIVFEQTWDAIRKRLDAADIWYMPLKGAVLKDYYPEYGMREMADYDVLFDAERADGVKTIMEGLGFTTVSFAGGCHDIYHKAPFLNYEMHTSLFGPGHQMELCAYYTDVKKRLIPGKGCSFHFSPEDFYLYMIAHQYKHFASSGTGLRSILDIYVYLRHYSDEYEKGVTQIDGLDMTYIEEEAEKLGIADYERSSRALAYKLFSVPCREKQLTDEEKAQLDIFLSSGTYGTIDRYIQNRLSDNGDSRIRYILGRLKVPISEKNESYKNYSAMYPLFYRHVILLPLLPLYRMLRSMKSGRFVKELKALLRVKV